MGYKVIYCDDKKDARRSKVIPMTVLFFAMFMGWVFRNWEQGREVVMTFLFSGAKEGLEAMADQLQSGAGLLDATEAFFRNVRWGSIEGPY